MIKPNKNVVVKPVREGQILLDLNSGDYYSLNSTGSELWNGIAAGQDVNGIAARMADEYDADIADIISDLQTLIRDLRVKNFIE